MKNFKWEKQYYYKYKYNSYKWENSVKWEIKNFKCMYRFHMDD